MWPRMTLIALALLVGTLRAQNLVRNPSVEGYTNCPIGMEHLFDAVAWMAAGYTPDYYDQCSFHPQNSVPSNYCGSQMPASGHAYAGEIFYGGFNVFTANLREYIYIPLLSPLTVGATYYVSFKVNLSENSSFACNRQGLKFVSSYVTPNSPTNSADVFSAAVISDKVNWVTVSGTYVATAAHNAIVVGNWFQDANTTFSAVVPTSNIGPIAYYYLDDFYVGLTPFVLPVTWHHVAAEVAGNLAHLDWELEAEDIVSFVVERSRDGIAFEESQTLAANPNATSQSAVDTLAGFGPSAIYRIRGIDRNGGTHLSPTVEAKRYPSDGYFLSAYPSFVARKGLLHVEYSASTGQATTWSILSLDGRTLRKDSPAITANGQYNFELPMEDFAAGTYLLRVGSMVQKFVVGE